MGWGFVILSSEFILIFELQRLMKLDDTLIVHLGSQMTQAKNM